eukprot:6401401-Alexandrium_andersonii.AAC.1
MYWRGTGKVLARCWRGTGEVLAWYWWGYWRARERERECAEATSASQIEAAPRRSRRAPPRTAERRVLLDAL